MRIRKGIISLIILVMAAAFFLYILSSRKNEVTSQPSSSEILRSLPYAAWIPAGKDIKKAGVTTYDPTRAFKGINIYNSRNLSKAHLIDMLGNIIHTWSADSDDDEGWQHVEICENGDLLAIVKDKLLIRLDWNSQWKWMIKMRFHHDIAVAENGEIYSIIREDDVVFHDGLEVPILNDSILVMSPDGLIKRKIPLFQIFKEDVPPSRLIEIHRWVSDPKNQEEIAKRKENLGFLLTNLDPANILHTNTVEVIDRDIDGLCRKGDLLICCLKLDLIAVIDMEDEAIIWKWGPGELDRPHHPTLLENGHILLFDNGVERRYSRLVELDPLKKEVAWEYSANPPENFFSLSRGSSQRLPNGNTLITESDRGRVFEVTPSGDVVWEFFNPEIDEEKNRRAAIYRMMRLADMKKYPFLKKME